MNELETWAFGEIAGAAERDGSDEGGYELQIVRDDEGRCREIQLDGAFRIRL